MASRKPLVLSPSGQIEQIQAADSLTDESGNPIAQTYAKLDGSNQPFTGNINISKASPKLTLTSSATDSPTTYLEKLSTFDGAQLVSQNRRYQPANAISFAGTGGSISSPPSLTTFSISFWYWSDNQNYQSVFSNGTQLINFRGQAVSPPYIRVQGYGGSTIDFVGPSGQPMLAGRWTHLVFMRNASTGQAYMYYDGVASPQNGSTIGTTTLSSWTLPTTTNGDLDEFICYDKILSAGEIAALYNSGAPTRITDYTNVVLHWSADQSSGTTLTDNSGNGRHVTGITGSSWITGKVSSNILQALTNVPLVKIINNGVVNSYGDLTYGYYTGSYGTDNYYDGLNHYHRVLGTTRLQVTSSGITVTGAATVSNITASTLTLSGALTLAGAIQGATSITFTNGAYGNAGLVGTPTYSFSSDTNTGMYSGGADILVFGTGGTERFRVDAAGYFGFGTATTSTTIKMRVAQNFTNQSQTQILHQAESTHTQSADNAQNTRSFYALPTLAPAGYNNTAAYSSGGALTGFYSLPQVNSSVATGAVTGVNAFFSSPRNTGLGTVTDMAGYQAATAINSGGGTITRAYGFYAGNQTGGTSNFGFYGTTVAAANAWNIYMAGSANNYLSGSLGIGTTTVSTKLHLVSTSNLFRAGYDASNYFNADVSATGEVTLDAVGSAPKFIFSNTIRASTLTADTLVYGDANKDLSSVTLGTGLSLITGTLSNTAPDQTVVLTAGTGIGITGTYPNFTITNSSPDQVVSITGDSNISVSGTYPSFSLSFTNGSGFLTSESDPVFSAWLATPPNISIFTNDSGYLTSYSETDPVFSAWLATPPNISIFTNDSGYLTSYSETDPVFSAWLATPPNISIFTNDSGYLTSFTETDPVFTASAAAGITGTQITNWDTAYGWGDHGTAGYAKLDGSNQPFTGNLNVSKSAPKITLTDTADGDNPTLYLEKLTSLNESRLVSKNRLYQAGTGLSLNGSGFASRAAVSLGTVFTVEAWYKTSSTASQMILSGTAGADIHIWFSASNTLTVRTNAAVAASWTVTYADNIWHHWAVVCNGTSVTLYKDGVSQGTVVTASAVSRSYTNIGNYGADSAHKCVGTIDELVIWNTNLSSGDITTRYNSGGGSELSSYTNVVAEYRLNSNYNDSSPNAYTCTAGGSGNSFVTGQVASSINTPTDLPVLTAKNNSVNLSYGTVTLGYYSGSNGTENYYDGSNHYMRVLGTTRLQVTSAGITVTGAATVSSITASTLTLSGALTMSGAFNGATSVTFTNGAYGNAGLVGTPTYSASSDTNTGMYFPAADTLGWATGGVERMRIGSAGDVTIGSTNAISTLAVEGGTASGKNPWVMFLGHSTTAPLQFFGRTGGTTLGSRTAIGGATTIGGTLWQGTDGTTFRNVAYMAVGSDGAISSVSSPGYIYFSTTPSGSTSVVERMRITSAGKIGVATGSPTGRIDISDGDYTLNLGADNNLTSRTDSTTKVSRVTGQHYTNAEEPMAILMHSSASSYNLVGIGGGSSLMNAATAINFYSAANTTTTTGTLISFIDNNGFNMSDAKDIIFNTTTGSKIGTATGQKLSLWNATPDVQPTTAITAATFTANTSGLVDDSATFDGYTIGQIVAALRRIGALA